MGVRDWRVLGHAVVSRVSRWCQLLKIYFTVRAQPQIINSFLPINIMRQFIPLTFCSLDDKKQSQGHAQLRLRSSSEALN
jgi:hypothetical protein